MQDYGEKNTKTGWTPERRAQQAEAIRRWKPWKKSTGPKTAAGKARVRWNAYKHGNRSREILDVMEYLRTSRAFLRRVNQEIRLRKQTIKLQRQNEEFLRKKNLKNNSSYSNSYWKKIANSSNKLLEGSKRVIFLIIKRAKPPSGCGSLTKIPKRLMK